MQVTQSTTKTSHIHAYVECTMHNNYNYVRVFNLGTSTKSSHNKLLYINFSAPPPPLSYFLSRLIIVVTLISIWVREGIDLLVLVFQ